ncbi:MAG: tRNA1Val (adenine37-N6)-methyltransferase [Paracoccaceae bacterium]|jgi:tRNA1Val (adenine37-N6)-methyltransferase
MFEPEALTCDGFLGGALQIWQPIKGYRAAMDSVLLAAVVPAKAGQSVLELGCGAGVASLCLARRVSGLFSFGVERQVDYANLARQNATENGLNFTVETADLENMPANLRCAFDHVIFNPPYFLSQRGTRGQDPGREEALREETSTQAWIDAATRRLAPGGRLHLIQSADRLPEILSAIDGRLGAVTLLPLAPRQGRAAKRFILMAQKGARSPFTLRAPFIIHKGENHMADVPDYTAQAEKILRHGAPLNFE